MEEETTNELGELEKETDADEQHEVPDESAYETARRIFDNAGEPEKESAEETEAEPEEKPAKQTKQAGVQEATTAKPAAGPDLDLLAPQSYTAEERAEFDKLKDSQKRAVSRLVKGLKSRNDREFTELQKNNQYARSIWEAAAPFAEKWGEQGVTIPQAVARLAAAHAKLTDPDQATRERHFLDLAQKSGIDVVLRSQAAKAATNGAHDIQAHPYVQQLEAKINHLQSSITPVLSYQEQLKKQQDAHEGAQLARDYEAVRNEINPVTGKHRYPELFNLTQETFSQFESAIAGLMQSASMLGQTLSKQDAIREAYQRRFGTTPRLQQSNPIAPQQNTRAQTANVSARRHATSASGGKVISDIPPEALADPWKTAEYVFNNPAR